MPQSRPFLLLLVSCFMISCSSSSGFGRSDLAPQTLDIQGTFDWIDGFDNNTACIVRVFWQDGAWRGWVSTNHESTEICPWQGYELPRLRMRGDRVRMSVACPRSGCPSGTRLGATYLLDVVPGVMLTGSSIGSEIPLRWRSMRLVRRNEF